MADEIRYLSYEGLDYFWNHKLKPEIEANEEVVAASLVDLDDRLKSHEHSYVASAGYAATAACSVTAARAFYSGSAGYAATAARSVTAARAVYSASAGYAATAGTVAKVKINLATNSVYYPMVFTNVISSNNAASLYIDGSTGTAQSSAGIRYNPSLNACYCSGGFYELSDESKKNFGDDIEVDLDKLSKLSKKYFTWKNDESNTRHIGISAQEVHELYPEIVNVIDEDGHLSVAYDKLSVVALKGIDVLNDKIKSLEERLERLEKLIKE